MCTVQNYICELLTLWLVLNATNLSPNPCHRKISEFLSLASIFLTSSRKKKILVGKIYWKKAKHMQVCILVCVICYDILPVAVQNSYKKTIKPERKKERQQKRVLYYLAVKLKKPKSIHSKSGCRI